LRKAGSSLAKIAATEGVAASTVTTVCQGYRRSRRIETAIAHALGQDPRDVFLDRNYDAQAHSQANQEMR